MLEEVVLYIPLNTVNIIKSRKLHCRGHLVKYGKNSAHLCQTNSLMASINFSKKEINVSPKTIEEF